MFSTGAQSGDSESRTSAAVTEAVLALWAERGVRNRYAIVGNSMLPLIRDGDVALVEHGTRCIRVGTVILFRSGQALTAHRVLRRMEDPVGAIIDAKGDNSPQVDQVPSGAVVGRILGIERGGRHLCLDTRLWRALGWLISMLSRGRPAARLTDPWAEPRRVGSESGRTTGWWRRLSLPAAVVPRAAQIFGGRWRPGSLVEQSERSDRR